MCSDVLRYWLQEYHVDGFRLTGFAPREAIAGDPFLRCTKLFADSWGRRPWKGGPKQAIQSHAGRREGDAAGQAPGGIQRPV